MLYPDGSVLVAGLTRETDAGRIQSWLAAQEPEGLAISDWVVAQFSSALSLKLRAGHMEAAHRAEALAMFVRNASQQERGNAARLDGRRIPRRLAPVAPGGRLGRRSAETPAKETLRILSINAERRRPFQSLPDKSVRRAVGGREGIFRRRLFEDEGLRRDFANRRSNSHIRSLSANERSLLHRDTPKALRHYCNGCPGSAFPKVLGCWRLFSRPRMLGPTPGSCDK
jgi:hypothetical protein